MRRLLLWDIDGTLLGADDLDVEVFNRAIELTLGLRPPEPVPMAGKTDPQIALEYLAMLDLAEDHHHVPTILGHLADEMAAAVSLVRRHDRVLPGVAELLGLLDADGRFVQTVLTGNIAPNALVKLAAFDLDRFVDLDIGAYGSDRTDRNELVPVALARAAEHRGLDFGADEVWVIGDSANDLACARAAGVRCLLVATGRLGAAELEALGPDAWRPDLADVADVAGLLAG